MAVCAFVKIFDTGCILGNSAAQPGPNCQQFCLQNPHCKCFDHKNYADWKLRGPCREDLHYLWKSVVRIVGKPHNCGETMQLGGNPAILIALFHADFFPCKDPTISSPLSFYGQNICRAHIRTSN